MTMPLFEFKSSFCDAFCPNKDKRDEDNCFICRAERMMQHLDDPIADHVKYKRRSKKHEER